MDQHRRPPSLNLISSSFPARPVSTSPSPLHRQSQSPFRYVQFHQDSANVNEKAGEQTQLSEFAADKKRPTSPACGGPSAYQQSAQSFPPSSPHQFRAGHPHRPSPLSQLPSPFLRQPTPLLLSSHTRGLSHSQPYTRPRGLRIANLIKPWLPLILYGITSLGFVVAIALYRTEVFARLDELSLWLQADEKFGHAVLFSLIFLTTFPPIPLYSTLIILSGYTFGPWTGAIISYFAALTGALTVFIISRTLLRDTISRWLASTFTIKRVVRAIEKRPKLLFLIRLAPYPYNVMNCLLAASPTLTLRTYTICTALSLFKVIIHTSLGASIHSFKDYHVVEPDADGTPAVDEDNSADTVARMWTIIGIVLCVAIFIYLSVVARRAVDEELDDEVVICDRAETLAFLVPRGDLEASGGGRPMVESPFRAHQLVPSRPSVSVELDGHGQWTR